MKIKTKRTICNTTAVVGLALAVGTVGGMELADQTIQSWPYIVIGLAAFAVFGYKGGIIK